jgi:hypothetical protein
LKKNESKNSLLKSKSGFKKKEKSINENDDKSESLENDIKAKEI